MTRYLLQLINLHSNHYKMLNIKYLLIIFIIATSGMVHAQSDADCRNTNYQALIDVYNATAGWDWTEKWDIDRPMEEWYGVKIQEGCVTELRLSNNNLNGTIPTSINNLSQLRQLDLSANNLNGTIPSNIGELTNLELLQLNQNQLNGEIPPSIGQLVLLQSMNLQYNLLSGSIPETFGSLQELRTLALDNNQLSDSIPATLGNLFNLNLLDLGNNQLSGDIPDAIGNLRNLTNLELDNNRLEGCLPSTISQLTRLQTLLLSENSFLCPFPTEIFSLSSLTWLYLDNNFFYGWIPDDFSSLSSLTVIHLNDNILSGPLPNSLGDLERLEEVRFQNNFFAGCYPGNYSNFCSISADFSGNSNLPNGGLFKEFFCTTGEGGCAPRVCMSFTIEGLNSDRCLPAGSSLTVNIHGGIPPFIVMLSGPFTGSGTTDNHFFGISRLSAGKYTIKITDSEGCESSQEFTVGGDCLTEEIAGSRSSVPMLVLEATIPVLQVQPSFPNPFTTETTIPIVLSEAQELNISVFTAAGKRIYQSTQLFDMGTNLIKLDKTVFNESGMYIYQIQQGDRVESGKLIKQ